MPVESAASAFQVHASDNVATLLGEAAAGAPLQIVGPAQNSALATLEKIELGHKVAITAIPEDAPVVKFGIVIGIATRRIEPGMTAQPLLNSPFAWSFSCRRWAAAWIRPNPRPMVPPRISPSSDGRMSIR